MILAWSVAASRSAIVRNSSLIRSTANVDASTTGSRSTIPTLRVTGQFDRLNCRERGAASIRFRRLHSARVPRDG
ncbi:Uncharacterised protein [Mycobacteroides abscessus subsp. abscessus]|nr:Uncharacterised protein [Mycobacteroides abscessus subsp. abscessus]